MNKNFKDINKKGNFWQENKFILLSFLISMIVITITYAVLLYYPFGSNTILKVDLYHQYAPFHEELRSKLLSGASLSYSWESGLGKELISQIAYYTASPISLLILLFPQKNLPEAMAFFAMLKISIASGIFTYYLKKVYNKNDLSITAFGLLYGFMAFLTSYYWNIMWLDAVAVFPLVALGIEKLVKEEKHNFYCVALAITVFVNFYIAFIVCVFAVLYFIVILLSNFSLKKDIKKIIRRCIIFAVSSLIGGCIAMIMILPTAIALSHTEVSDSNFPSFKMYETAFQLIENNFLMARPVVLGRNEDLPNIYSGLITAILIPSYFANRKFEVKQKVLYALLIIFIYACSCINVLDYLIHGMHFPANLPHRYAFIYSFIILTLAYRVFLDIEEISIPLVIGTCIAYMFIILVCEYMIVPRFDEVERVFTDKKVIINAIFMLVYCIYILFAKESIREYKNQVLAVLLCFVIVENVMSSINGFSDRMTWNKTESQEADLGMVELTWTEKLFGGKFTGTTDRNKYIKYLDGGNAAMDYIKENYTDDNKFYRQEFRRFAAINEGSFYHYNGLSQFSSLANGDTSAAMGNLGIASTGNSYRYYDPTPLFNSLFNIKYILNKDNALDKTDYKFIDSFGATEENDYTDTVYLYENEQPLSLGFMVNNDVKDWDMSCGNPFTIQNEFLKLATGEEHPILNEIGVYDLSYEYINIIDINDDNKEFKYELAQPYSLSNVPVLRAKVHNDKEQRVFLYVNAGNAKQFTYSFPGITQNRDLSTGSGFIDCGIVPADCDIDIKFFLDRKGEFEKTYRKNGEFRLYAAVYDPNEFAKAYDQLNDEILIVDDYSDDYIHGNIDVKNDGVMFTSIPYDEGWKLTVDGQEVDFISVADGGFIGVELTAGNHEIYFKYKPKGLVVGAIVSIIALGVFVFFLKRGYILKKEDF